MTSHDERKIEQRRHAGMYPGFDRFGRVVRHLWVDGDYEPHASVGGRSNYPPLAHLTYSYDQASNRLDRKDVLSTHAWTHRDHEFDYDGLHRLAEAKRGVRDGSFTHSATQPSQQWSLDAIGNWSEFATWGGSAYDDVETRTHSDANEVTGRVLPDTTALAATYDKAGNLRTQEIGDGSVEVVYTWDGWNRLVKVEYDSDTRAEYDYNGLNWRIAKRADMASPPEGEPTQERLMYYNAQWQLVEEHITDDLLAMTPAINRHMQYVWGTRYIDDIIMRRQNRNLGNDSPDITYEDTWYHLTDALFSTVAVINAAGVVVDRVSYSPYGAARHHRDADLNGDGNVDVTDQLLLLGAWGPNTLGDLNRSGDVGTPDLLILLGQWGPGAPSGQLSWTGGSGGNVTDNIVGFAGYIFNAEMHTSGGGAGLYTVRHRHYDPELGRWLSRDPLGYVDGMGVYEYVRGQVTHGIDPNGLSCSQCERAKQNLQDTSLRLLDNIRHNCPQCGTPSITCNDCRTGDCARYNFYGFVTPSEGGGCPSITICCGTAPQTADGYQRTITHELVHYWDLCAYSNSPSNWNECAWCMYTEMRAQIASRCRVGTRHAQCNCARELACLSCARQGRCFSDSDCNRNANDYVVPLLCRRNSPDPRPWIDPPAPGSPIGPRPFPGTSE